MNPRSTLPWIGAVVFGLALLFSRAVFPEILWAGIASAVLFLAFVAVIFRQNWKDLNKRTAAFGLNSLVTILLVVAILGVLNFLSVKFPKKLDVTKNRVNTLSDQTEKVMKNLSVPVKATFFSTLEGRERLRPLLENYKSLSSKFDIEYVDPFKEVSRAKIAGVKQDGTLQLTIGARETKIENATEEKLTNSIIKLLKEKSPTVCNVTQHGEKDFGGSGADGYDLVKKTLAAQAYEIKDLNLVADGKIPENCSVVTLLGPTKALFPQEVTLLKNYLLDGGRAIIAIDLNVKGTEYSPETVSILKDWYLEPKLALVIDPISRALQLEPTVPLIPTYAKDNPITKDMQGNTIFPLSRPIEAMKGAPAELKIQWLAQSTPNAWGETGFASLAAGSVKFDAGSDIRGPVNLAYAVEGKKKESKGSRPTRLVVFGSSNFASNQFARFGNNLDFFANAVSWAIEDEGLISIRAKEDAGGKIELTERSGTLIFLLTIFVLPLLISIAGIAVWFIRRKL